MVFFLYSNKAYEHQAIACIKSLSNRVTDDVKIVYYTIGFDSDFEFKNLTKVYFPLKDQYPSFYYYKAELSLLTMDMFPNEYYMFSDTDILYSRRFSFDNLKHDLPYPKASFGPHEYPFMWELDNNGETVVLDETRLMKYLNVPGRTQRYVWSCMYTFNSNCRDFFEEYTSLCNYKYLLDRRWYYYPMHDETPFNICLWKRNATENLGFSFLNTHSPSAVKLTEENIIKEQNLNNHFDAKGNNWEYIHDSEQIIAYHGFKEKEGIDEALNYLLNGYQ
jgi:hypothetical protein